MANQNKYDNDGLLKSKYIAENLASIMPYNLKKNLLTTHIYNHIKIMRLIKYEGMLFEEYHKYPTDYTPPEKFTDLYFKRIEEMGY